MVLWSPIGILMHLLDAEPRSTAGFVFLSVSLSNDLADPVFDGVGLTGFKSRANSLFWHSCSLHFLSPTVFPISSFGLWVGIVGLGSSD